MFTDLLKMRVDAAILNNSAGLKDTMVMGRDRDPQFEKPFVK
jgi:hypothetical protein